MKVLVTGERGQLGNELRRCFDTMRAEIGPVPGVYKDAKVDYVDYQVLDISDADAVDAWYAEHGPYDLSLIHMDATVKALEDAFAALD